ncbi:MAG: DUF2905 domain-containing protein [Candidatus Omnitrophica bacterium]|nr:DUF2905 domain-containing protein [Candidatus Omnitrophota bacterium]
MNGLSDLGKILILCGIVMIVVGIVFAFMHKVPYLGRLPGDIYIQKKNFTFYFPLATSIVISIILSLIFWLFFRK